MSTLNYNKKDLIHLKWTHFIFQIKYYRSYNIQTSTSFKILNHVTICKMLDIENKILTVKLTKLRRLGMESILFETIRGFAMCNLKYNNNNNKSCNWQHYFECLVNIADYS